MTKNKVYIVHAHRFGDRECHSYHVGLFSKKLKAMKAAQAERQYRGGKYECEILETTIDSKELAKQIKPLEEINQAKQVRKHLLRRGDS